MTPALELADSHCHIQSIGAAVGEQHTRERWEKAGTTAEAVIERAHAAGVTRLVCVGCDVDDSRLAVAFVQEREGCWASIGIHPHEALPHEKNFHGGPAGTAASIEHWLQALDELAKAPKVVAVGECGLDYFYEHSDRTAQREMLRLQIALALAHDLPLIFHVRDAFDDFWPIFEEYLSGGARLRGVVHSFTDSQANLERALSHGLYIGVNGIATFTKDAVQQTMYRAIPLDRLLLETDAPFLTPHPNRGRINESRYIGTIAEFLAAARGESLEVLASTTTRNFRELFRV